MNSICGIDCMKCELSSACSGCAETEGRPFGAECVVALCFQKGKTALCEFKEKLIAAFNGLNIQDMEEMTDRNALKGSFVNIEYAMPKGQLVKFLDDESDMPTPEFFMAIRANNSVSRKSMEIFPPAGVYFTALSTIL